MQKAVYPPYSHYPEAKKAACEAMKEVFGCPEACTAAQLDHYHETIAKIDTKKVKLRCTVRRNEILDKGKKIAAKMKEQDRLETF